ncbi:putative nuclease [Rosellinia necatrix]|uniref:Putative nuclease n=1 Tax=Rosellinia necatrix TaxID=77044 RepID=A0A1W2THC3_ROSNE|nr:putative nuclease [Rosellinia necatrix]
MPATADLRIASKRARYNNNSPFREIETIVLYIYNAGPDGAVAPVVHTGYTSSMNYDAVGTTLREVREWCQPSEVLTRRASQLNWASLLPPVTHYAGWGMVTTLPYIAAGTLLELSLSFPMTHEWTWRDSWLKASIHSDTVDPRPDNNITHYVVTPNHNADSLDYLNALGDLANMDFDGFTVTRPVLQTNLQTDLRTDLRIASLRAYYSNDNRTRSDETLTFLIFNYGPVTAIQPHLTVEYAHAMDYESASCRVDQVWVPEGIDSTADIESCSWQMMGQVSCWVNGWNITCGLPDLHPSMFYRVRVKFPFSRFSFPRMDNHLKASIESDVTKFEKKPLTRYYITPNHSHDGDFYWETEGNLQELFRSLTPSGNRQCFTR